jgi:hypothetical protein
MSIGPVQNFAPVELASGNAQHGQPHSRRQAQPHPVDAPENIPPNAGNDPNPEAPVLKHTPVETQQPEDAVELQRDSELQNELIVRYVDGSGNLILQVPAEQVLRFQRAIAADFQKAQSVTPAAGTDRKGESHGH